MLVLDPKRTALALAILFACWHLSWSALVLIGWAQAIIDFIFWMHFIRTIYVIEPFSAGRALTLIAVTSALGALIGYSFARLGIACTVVIGRPKRLPIIPKMPNLETTALLFRPAATVLRTRH
jgi:hypothetical protein